MAPVGRVHQQEADPELLLLRQLVGPEAPQVPQGEVPRPVHTGVGTAVAAGPQKQRPAEGPAVLRLVEGMGIHGAVVVDGGEVAVFPALHLVAEADGLELPAPLFLNIAGHVLPHAGGGHPVAHQIAGGQVLRAAAQVAIQPVHLAGGAGEEDLPGL